MNTSISYGVKVPLWCFGVLGQKTVCTGVLLFQGFQGCKSLENFVSAFTDLSGSYYLGVSLINLLTEKIRTVVLLMDNKSRYKIWSRHLYYVSALLYGGD